MCPSSIKWAAALVLLTGLGTTGCGNGNKDKKRDASPSGETDANSDDDSPAPPPGDPAPQPSDPTPPSEPNPPHPTVDTITGTASRQRAFVVRVDWTNEPVQGLENRFTLVFGGSDGQRATLVDGVAVTPWMTIHDHGAPMRQQRIEPTDAASEFVVGGVNFIMPGEWDLKISATVNGTADEATVKVEVP